MKKILYILTVAIVVFFTSCEKATEFSNNAPRIELLTPTLTGVIGNTVTIQAKLEDDFVLKYAKITCPSLSLNQMVNITVKGLPTKVATDVIKSSADFSYTFTIPTVAVHGTDYEITLQVKNVTGQSSFASITLHVD
jgi:hypothetical protein